MEIFDGPYYKCSNLFLRSVGLWPYQSKSKRLCINIIFCVINLSLALPQALLLAQKWGKDFNITFENLAAVMFSSACLAKYLATYSNAGRLEVLFLQIANDWQRITDKEEHKILMKFYKQAKKLLVLYTMYSLFAWLVWTVMPFTPLILDHAFPLNNGTRDLLLPFYADYIIIDQNDYHYWACGHISVVYFTSLLLFCGVDGIYVLTVKHTCGLFAITCNRLEKLSKSNENSKIMKVNVDIILQLDLISTVTMHNETIRCFNLLEDSLNKCFIVEQSLCVGSLSVLGVYMLYCYDNTFIFLRISTIIGGIIVHLLYLNWIGQKIIESSEEVFDSAYNSDWYIISTNSRKFINLIMIRSLKPCELTAGKLSSLSIESFGILMKASISYFTVVLSVT